MEFEFFIKNKNKYEKKSLIPESGAGVDFFKQLKTTIEEQNNNIRHDIVTFFDNKENVNLQKPNHEDKKIQEKLNKLKNIRRKNLNTIEEIKYILSSDDFIICEYCGSKMYKVPIGVKYEKVGGTFVLKESPSLNTRYIYSCSNENCHHCMEEEMLSTMRYYKNLRNALIHSGSTYIPNEFGFWSEIE